MRSRGSGFPCHQEAFFAQVGAALTAVGIGAGADGEGTALGAGLHDGDIQPGQQRLRLSAVRLMRTAPLLTQMSDTSASRPL